MPCGRKYEVMHPTPCGRKCVANSSDTVWTKVRGNSSDAVRTKVQDIAMHPRHRVDEDVRPMLCERRNATMSAPIQLGQCRVTEEVCREGRQ